MFDQVLVPGHNLAITVLYALIPSSCSALPARCLPHDGMAGYADCQYFTIPLGVLVWKADFGGTMKPISTAA